MESDICDSIVLILLSHPISKRISHPTDSSETNWNFWVLLLLYLVVICFKLAFTQVTRLNDRGLILNIIPRFYFYKTHLYAVYLFLSFSGRLLEDLVNLVFIIRIIA